MTISHPLRYLYFTVALISTANGLGVWPERHSFNTLVKGVRDAIPELPDITPPIFKRQNADTSGPPSDEADKAANTTNAIWILEDEYAGQNFFE